MDRLKKDFLSPPDWAKPVPKWIWNAPLEKITREKVREQFAGFKQKDGYGGVMFVLWGQEGYLTEPYFEKYGMALKEAKAAGLSVILWDENGFPSGYAGDIIAREHPEYLARSLEERHVISEGRGEIVLTPDGEFCGAVTVDTSSGAMREISECFDGEKLRFFADRAGQGVILFSLKETGANKMFTGKHKLIDYLNGEAVDQFIKTTHQAYYDRFAEYFGETIVMAFYDEPSFYNIDGARIWTRSYNQKFREKYGFSPVLLYGALWMDIWPDAQWARNLLLGFRAELFATEYVGRLARWCEAHGIKLTGHMDQEEIVQPVPLSGDLMKVFRDQHIPGVDEIFKYGRGSRAYKLISSAAANYGKTRVMCESLGAMGEDIPIDTLYQEAMDQHAKGVNFTVPHGAWYDNSPDAVCFPPELSFRSEKFGPALPEYNAYLSRLSAVLSQGKLCVDTAVLYPIEDLQAGYRFGPEDQYLGGVYPKESNYFDIGEALSLKERRDFVYLHPDILRELPIQHGALILNNDACDARITTLILPAMRVIGKETMRKIYALARAGGSVISVGGLPSQATHIADSAHICIMVQQMRAKRCETLGEMTGFIASLPADVSIQGAAAPQGGNLSYIHKSIGGRQVYFFANSGGNAQSLTITLQGAHEIELWDPHKKTFAAARCAHRDGKTVFPLEINGVHSVFAVSRGE